MFLYYSKASPVNVCSTIYMYSKVATVLAWSVELGRLYYVERDMSRLVQPPPTTTAPTQLPPHR